MRSITFNNILELKTVDSTNSYLKKHISGLKTGTVVFSGEQTSGRGRMNRNWQGEKDKSVFCSFLLKEMYEPIDAVRITFLFSIAVRFLLLKYIPNSKIKLKWPNDVLCSGKKICGILSEHTGDSVISGIGLNVLNFDPEKEIEQPWTTVESESGSRPDIAGFKISLIECVNQVFERYCTTELSDIPSIWFREAGILNRRVSVVSGKESFSGKIRMTDSNGGLVITDERTGELRSIYTGDINYDDKL